MNFKKFISGVSAFAIAASAFAGMAVTANADNALGVLYSHYFGDDTDATTGGDAGIFTGGATNYTTDLGWHFRACTSSGEAQKMTATFSSAYEMDADQSIEVSYKAYHGYLSGTRNATIALYNADDYEIASYTYDANNLKITDVKIAGVTPSNFESFSLVSTNARGTTLNRYDTDSSSRFAKADNCNPKISFTLGGDGSVMVKFVQTTKSVSVKYTGNVAAGTKLNVKKLAMTSNNIANNNRAYGIDDFKIERKTLGEAYTLRYMLNSTPVLTIAGNAQVGDIITAENVINTDSGRYYLDESGATSMTIVEGTNSLDVNVRQANVYNMKAETSGDISKDITASNVTEGDSFWYGYPKYWVNDKGTDNTVVATCDYTYYSASLTPSKSETFTIPYTAYTDNTSYCIEGEDVKTSNVVSDSDLSGGKAARALNSGKYKLFTVPESGYYTVTVVAGIYNGGEGTVYLYKDNSNEATPIITSSISTDKDYSDITSNGTDVTQNVLLRANDTLYVSAGYSTEALDYVLLTKTDDVATAGAVSAPTTFDSEPDTPVKSYTFTATPGTSNGVTQALNSVTVTVKVDGYEDKSQTKTSADFGTISGPATFAVLIGGDVTPTAINVTVN